MKIIATDNLDRETVSDYVIAENVTEFYGDIIVDYLNNKRQFSDTYFKLVEDNHKLHVYEP